MSALSKWDTVSTAAFHRRLQQGRSPHCPGPPRQPQLPVPRPSKRSCCVLGHHHERNPRPESHQIPGVLGGPALRTLCSCWNHGNRGPTFCVTECTRRWVIKQWITVVVDFREYVITSSSSIVLFILYSGDDSNERLLTCDVFFHCGLFGKQVAAAATFEMMWIDLLRVLYDIHG